MSITKIFLIILTVIGIGLIAFGISINIRLDRHVFLAGSELFQNYVWGGAFIFVASGTLLSIIGVSVGGLRYFGTPLVVIGVISVISLVGMYYQFYMPEAISPHLKGLVPDEILSKNPNYELIRNLYFIIPGVISIIAGTLLLRRRQGKVRHTAS
jgi:hypothetical protein